jgi:hypothetical protein
MVAEREVDTSIPCEPVKHMQTVRKDWARSIEMR